jgi:hypothetical protein
MIAEPPAGMQEYNFFHPGYGSFIRGQQKMIPGTRPVFHW